MKTIPISHVLAALGFAALAILAAIYIPEQRLEKLADLVGRIVEDPAGALAAVSLLGGAIATLRAAWLRQPPGGPPPPPAAPPSAGGDSDGPPTRPRRVTMPSTAARVVHAENRRRFFPATALLSSVAICFLAGCGAGALRAHSTAASIASATIGDLDVRVSGACAVALSSCRGEASCREQTAERCRVAAHAAEGLVASVRAYHDGITAATYADEGDVLPALLAVWRGIHDAWPAIRAALTAIGLDVSWTPEAL